MTWIETDQSGNKLTFYLQKKLVGDADSVELGIYLMVMETPMKERSRLKVS